ncbi:MAG: amino acid ABC transporter permease [Christensenellales bacterium]|jgi:His/Glu/Gln/Arg/opine family amino acid ABC transporter permease subunit
MPEFLQKLIRSFEIAVIDDNRWKMYLEGIGNTLAITAVATLIGIFIGMVVAIVKVAAVKNRRLRPLESLCDLYLTVIRGTPVVVQLLILYTVVFASMRNSVPVAMIGFGINSGAYVAEIFRSGIQSIELGQTEAGRSLGLTQGATMRFIILPQAIKNILPALFNEFIVLLKETSVVGYIAVRDLTKVADGIKGSTFEPMPLYVAALVYLVMVIGLTQVQKRLERRLSAGDRR